MGGVELVLDLLLLRPPADVLLAASPIFLDWGSLIDRAVAGKAAVKLASVGFVSVLGFMVLGHGGSGKLKLVWNCVDLKS
jgi:hypothetical protein